MKISTSDLRKLIIEALTGLNVGTKNKEGGYDFSEKSPEDMDSSSYSDRLSSGLGSSTSIKNFFKSSIIPINLVIVPDLVYADLFSTAMESLFWMQPRAAASPRVPISINDFGGMLSTSTILNKLRGKSDEIKSIKEKLDSNSLNLLIQGSDYETTQGNFFDLAWFAHDTLGHFMNFGLQMDGEMTIDKVKHRLIAKFEGIGSTQRAKKGGVEDKLGIGYTKKDWAFKSGSLLDAVKKDLEKINFAPGALDDDVATSLIAYYVINGKWTDSVYDAVAYGDIDQKFLNKYESFIKKVMSSLVGSVLISTVESKGG